MRDFDSEFARIRKQGQVTSYIVLAMVTFVMVVLIGGGGYIVTHPELIGSFAGKIVAGFEHSRN